VSAPSHGYESMNETCIIVGCIFIKLTVNMDLVSVTPSAEQFGVVVILHTCISGVLGSNFCRDTGCP
jgi:hypothetical protein